MFNKFRARKASISIEVSLSVLLASAVLIIALGLFSENLKAMALNSSMTNFFKGNRAKTANTYMDTNPVNNRVTVAQLPAAQNVGIVGDQGQTVDSIHNEAKATIEALAKLPQPLSGQQLIDLALALTLFGESGTEEGGNVLKKAFVEGTNTSYKQLGKNNGINVYFENGAQYTDISSRTSPIYWDSNAGNENASYDYTMDTKAPLQRVANLNGIRDCFKNQ